MAMELQVRGSSPDPQTLHACLAETCSESDVLHYMTNMWTQVIDASPTAAAWHDRWGELQLPYVPIEPERYGMLLSADSEVLDIGCLSGYGMFDFFRQRRASGLPVPRLTGIDNDAAACEAGRLLASYWADEEAEVRFLTGDCAALPFPDHTFDLLIARCVLAYVDLETGLRELRRVLQPSGLAVIQVHGPRYYWARVAASLRRPSRLAYYVRPLISSAALAFSGRPPRNVIFRETALTARGITALCRRVALSPVWVQATPYRPLVVFRCA